MNPTDILLSTQRDASKTYLSDNIRIAVESWRENDYHGATETSKRLLRFWFEEDHLIDDEPFNFWFAQREAIETLIYIYEVLGHRNFIDMAREFGKGPIPSGYDPSLDSYPLYGFKMATGSGKTFVMAFTIIWSYFNSKKENSNDYTSKFLLIAPNVIVYDRLMRDFKSGDIFKEYPFIPSEWDNEFNLDVILRKEPIHQIPEDVLFLTNIQRLEDRRNNDSADEVETYIDDILAIDEEVNRQDIYNENRIREVLATCPNIMILKDEAHHIYDVEKAWKKILMDLNDDLLKSYNVGINSEFDFSATPKSSTGAFFPWIIMDFTLKEAIEMNIVKRPLKGEIEGLIEVPSDNVIDRYGRWIDMGVNRWRQYKEKLNILDKKPILFIMCETTNDADEVAKYLEHEPDLKNKVLLIHTNQDGTISEAKSKVNILNALREDARRIDELDNPYEAIVSVMMLNEGWDVRNVNIIVGLRSYNSKREVLPEQVIGRGLRKMFPEAVANVDQGINTLEVIGPPGLIKILDDLEKTEGIVFAPIKHEVEVTTIYVLEEKMDMDIELPILSPRIVIREFSIDDSDDNGIPSLNFPLEDKISENQVQYVARDMLDDYEVVRETWDLPVPQDSKMIINYYTFQLQRQLGMGQVFSELYPIVKKYVIDKLFNQKVKLDDPRVVRMLGLPVVFEKLRNIFVTTFRERGFTEVEPEIVDKLKLSSTRPFVWPKHVYPGDKCIFNYCPCDSNLEVDFCKFLDNADDVIVFAKIPHKAGFYVEYKDHKDNLRHYYPDFVVLDNEGIHYIIETKGFEDVDVPYKDKRIKKWCEDVSELTGDKWEFVKVMQDDFYNGGSRTLNELVFFCGLDFKYINR